MPYKDPDKRREHRHQYYLNNREKALAQMAEWRRKNPERHASARRRFKLWSKYGLTTEQYRTLLDKQEGTCAICSQDAPARALHVDHDHETGEVRGLLCNNCNRGLGLLKDDVVVLRSAITYLEGARA